MDLYKIFKWVAVAIGIIAFAFFIRMVMIGGDVIENDPSQQGVANTFVMFAFWLLVIIAVITLVLSVLTMVKNPQNLKKTLMGIGILIVLLGISYAISSGDAVMDSFGKVVKDGEAGPTSKWVGTLLTFTYLLGLGGLVAIGMGFVKSMVK